MLRKIATLNYPLISFVLAATITHVQGMLEHHLIAAINEFGQYLWNKGVNHVGLSIGGIANVLLWFHVYYGVGINSILLEDLQCGEGANVGLGVVFGHCI